MPLSDRPQFAGWSSDASRLLDDDLGEEELNAGVVAAISFAQYFAELFEVRRSDPRDDLRQRAAGGRGGGRPADASRSCTAS